MGIVIRGMTPCAICGRIIEDGQRFVGLPAFVTNELDPLLLFNDAAFHEECFVAHSLAAQALSRVEELKSHTGPGKRVCVVCGKEITHPDDYFMLGHLVDDAQHPLYQYQYTHAHLSCLPLWKDREHVLELLKGLKYSGAWSGPVLEQLLNALALNKT